MFKFLLTILFLFLFGLWVEYCIRHPTTINDAVKHLWEDIIRIISPFFGIERKRFQLSEAFAEHMRMVAKKYADPAFDIYVGQFSNYKPPFIYVEFVPDHLLNGDEIANLRRRLVTKMAFYLRTYNMHWDITAEVVSNDVAVCARLYYAEDDFDKEDYERVTHHVIKANRSPEREVLKEDKLEEELDDVD